MTIRKNLQTNLIACVEMWKGVHSYIEKIKKNLCMSSIYKLYVDAVLFCYLLPSNIHKSILKS